MTSERENAMSPVISSLSPNQGPTVGGNTVTIGGTGFLGTASVKFGATTTPFSVVNDTQITATAPPGTGPVIVTASGPSGTSNGRVYTYTAVAAPVITTLSPNQGPAIGGNTVTIGGTGFLGTTSVKFGATTAPFTVVNATQITATAPPAAAVPASVSVTTPSGISNPVPYFYIAAPTLAMLEPTMGPVAGGNTVTITGTNLSLASAVKFGPNTATNLAVLSDNEITAEAPGGTGTITVTVTTPGGTSWPGQGNAYYTYLQLPVINSLTPNQGPAFAGTNISIAGSRLTFTDEVSFGGGPAPFSVLSDNLVIATAPAGMPGAAAVIVHTPGGNSNAVTYTRIAPPE
jgi:hypothetical protein